MKILEFYAKFSSRDESSLLFEILRRLSLLDGIASMSGVEDMGWLTWPPDAGPGGDSPFASATA